MDASAGLPPGNPFEAALASVTQLFPPAPAGYKYRIGAQIALCALLMVLSFAYVTLLVVQSHKTGVRSAWLFKLQKGAKTKWRSRVMINTLPVFSILAFLGAGGQLGSRYYNWMVFIEGRKPLGYTAAQFTPWVPVFVQAWFFSFTNLQATIGARGRLGGKFSWTCHPVLYNFMLIGVPIIYVIIILPIALTSSAKQDSLFRNTWALEPILRKASADYSSGAGFDMTVMYQLQVAQAALAPQSAEVKKYIVLLCGLCLALSSLIGVMNVCNLFLVWTLRKSVKFINSRSGVHSGSAATGGVNWDAEVNEGAIDAGRGGYSKRFRGSWGFGLKSTTSSAVGTGTGSSSEQNGRRPSYTPSSQDLAMKRLAADLSVAIPCVLAMVIIMVVGLAVLINKHFENLTWTIQEFTIDGFCYIYTILTILTIIFLIWNITKAWRIQQAVTPLNTASILKSDTTSFPWHNTRPLSVALPVSAKGDGGEEK